MRSAEALMADHKRCDLAVVNGRRQKSRAAAQAALHWSTLLCAAVVLSACGSLPESLGGKPAASGGNASSATPASAGSAAPKPGAAGATTTSVAPAPSAAPVSPATQRSFDDALRALKAGRTDEAERGFRTLAQAQPELAGAHANLGLIHRQAGKLPEAAAELERAVQLSPSQPLYFNQLGIVYRQQGQFTKAREAYEKAVALDANYAAATLNLGVLHDLYLWDASKALALYERYLALTPGGDATVSKWVADLKNRKPAAAGAATGAAAANAAPARKEKE